jgi:hypothetical protein
MEEEFSGVLGERKWFKVILKWESDQTRKIYFKCHIALKVPVKLVLILISR